MMCDEFPFGFKVCGGTYVIDDETSAGKAVAIIAAVGGAAMKPVAQGMKWMDGLFDDLSVKGGSANESLSFPVCSCGVI
jgi:hypothetical protein